MLTIINKLYKFIFFTINNNQKTRFLLVGGYNFIFSYVIGLLVYKYMKISFTIITIFYILNVIHNYFTHKYFSFRKKKICYREIARAIIVYGSMYFISTFIILFLIKIGFSQLIVYHVNIVISLITFYFLHCYFTFRIGL